MQLILSTRGCWGHSAGADAEFGTWRGRGPTTLAASLGLSGPSHLQSGLSCAPSLKSLAILDFMLTRSLSGLYPVVLWGPKSHLVSSWVVPLYPSPEAVCWGAASRASGLKGPHSQRVPQSSPPIFLFLVSCPLSGLGPVRLGVPHGASLGAWCDVTFCVELRKTHEQV